MLLVNSSRGGDSPIRLSIWLILAWFDWNGRIPRETSNYGTSWRKKCQMQLYYYRRSCPCAWSCRTHQIQAINRVHSMEEGHFNMIPEFDGWTQFAASRFALLHFTKAHISHPSQLRLVRSINQCGRWLFHVSFERNKDGNIVQPHYSPLNILFIVALWSSKTFSDLNEFGPTLGRAAISAKVSPKCNRYPLSVSLPMLLCIRGGHEGIASCTRMSWLRNHAQVKVLSRVLLVLPVTRSFCSPKVVIFRSIPTEYLFEFRFATSQSPILTSLFKIRFVKISDQITGIMFWN
jgi:hypothetical protein